jgi:hypothetical protein
VELRELQVHQEHQEPLELQDLAGLLFRMDGIGELL